jgi:FKBP-type peptidyl-prolyl cis-trans isomerase (trigger factor)
MLGAERYIFAKTPNLPALLQTGDTVKVQYSGKLDNGKVFDSGDISFPLGAGHVIKGWDIGVNGMKVGEERKLVIPPAVSPALFSARLLSLCWFNTTALQTTSERAR